MVFSHSTFTLPFALSAMLLAVSPTQAQVGKSIPPVNATLLTGTAVALPQDLHGEPAVLVLGFTQASRPQVADWGKRLTAQYGGARQVRWFEVADLESVPRPLRGWVTRKVRQSVSARGQQTFLIVTDHEREWKQVAGFETPDTAYVVVIDGAGTVRAVTHGAVGQANFQQVTTAVDAARTARP